MFSVVGTIFAMRSTSLYGISMARPTSLIAAFAAMVPKVMICATFSRPYFSRDVVDHLTAPVHAEIDVDIGHRNALGIQKALKQQLVLQGINVGDSQRIGDQRAGGRSAARTYGNVVFPCVADEVPDDQEIARKLHLLDDRRFPAPGAARNPQDCASAVPCSKCAQNFQPPRKTFAGDVLEIAVEREARREHRSAERDC